VIPIQPRLLTIKDACRFAATGKTRLYEWINNGEVEAVKDGGGRFTRIVFDSLERKVASLPPYRPKTTGPLLPIAEMPDELVRGIAGRALVGRRRRRRVSPDGLSPPLADPTPTETDI
jgi:excisionase family DNA binding protein